MSGPGDIGGVKTFAPTPTLKPPAPDKKPEAGPDEAARVNDVAPARRADDAAAPGAKPPPDFGAVPVHDARPGPAGGLAQTLDRFAFDSDALTAAQSTAIDAFAASVVKQAGQGGGQLDITVTGHTDTMGEESYNQGLGQRRADKVRAALQAALTKAGLGPTWIASMAATSAGETRPEVVTKDNVREPRNRRVVIEIAIPVAQKAVTFDPLEEPKPKSRIALPDKFNLPPGGVPPLATPVPNPKIPNPAGPSREWLENYFKNDKLLRELPKAWRDQLVTPLKDLDEGVAKQIIEALPITNKDAVTAAVRALLETLKGRKFTPPQPPPVQPNFPPEHQPQQLPGQFLPMTPKVPLPKPFN